MEGTNPSEKSGQEDLQTTPCTGFVGRALTAGRGGRPHRSESHSSLQTLNDDAEKATLKGLFLQAFAIENERKFSVDAMVIAWFMVRSV